MEWITVIFCFIFAALYIWFKIEQHRRRKVERYISGMGAVNFTKRRFYSRPLWRD